MPKTKEQKRREAIERLERTPRWTGRASASPDWVQKVHAKRLEEAARLRRVFNG